MKNIYASFIAAKKAFAPVIKDKVNPHFKSKYAPLATCLEAVEPALLENGIALIQETSEDLSGVTIETVFIHTSGESMRGGKFHVPASKQDPQGYGSALTYARRFSLCAACGIAPEDDDGNAASEGTSKTEEVNRTKVMKVREAIQKHVAADRPMGVAEEWDAARELGEDFQSGVWNGLTSPERDYIRQVNNNRQTAKA